LYSILNLSGDQSILQSAMLALLRGWLAFAGIYANAFRLSNRKAEVSNGQNEYAAGSNCHLTSGFSVMKGCGHSPAVEALNDCEDGQTGSACIETQNIDTQNTGYKRFVHSTDEWNSLTKAVVDAEGGGYGLAGSVGFNYMKTSKTRTNAIGFFTGSSVMNRHRIIHNYTSMKAFSTAKTLIGLYPSMFAATYGLSYVYGIRYGGSFIGSFQINERSSDDDSSLGGMIKLGYEEDAFSAKGSAEFAKQRSQLSTNVEISSKALWSGGTNLKQNYSSPESLQAMFDQWNTNVATNPAPLKLTTRGWFDVQELQMAFIQEYMSKPDAMEWMQKLTGQQVPSTLAAEIGSESLQLARIKQSAEDAQAYSSTSRDAKRCLQGLDRLLLKKLIEVNELDEEKVLDISAQIRRDNYDWFVSDNFQDQYEACMSK